MSEQNINFVDTASVSWVIIDDPANNRYDIEATAAAAPPYVPPTASEQIADPGPGVSINDGATQPLKWVHHTGSNLLDLTNPLLPVVITSGIYAVTVSVLPAVVLSGGGQFHLDLQMSAVGITALSPSTTASANPRPKVSLCLVDYMVAGAAMQANVTNFDGVAARNFILSTAQVQRIT